MRRWSGYPVLLLALVAMACGVESAPAGLPSPQATSTPASNPVVTARRTPARPPVAAVDSPAPTLGNWHDLVFDERLRQVVLVNGGPEAGKPSGEPVELWGWDGLRWSLLSADPNGPRWRNFASAAYDTRRRVLVLYGGLQDDRRPFAETWEWDGEAWAQRPGDGPGLREGAGMTYDHAREKVVLFGGAQAGRMMSDTWEWDGERWVEIPASGPAARFPAGLAYDAALARVLLFGGHAIDQRGFVAYGDTWLWDGTAWQFITGAGPAPRDGARVAFDTKSATLLLFGGVQIQAGVKYFTDTWLWDGAQWREEKVDGPSGRVHPAMAYDAARGRIVLAGGSDAPGVILPDVWEWDRRAWACVFRCE